MLFELGLALLELKGFSKSEIENLRATKNTHPQSEKLLLKSALCQEHENSTLLKILNKSPTFWTQSFSYNNGEACTRREREPSFHIRLLPSEDFYSQKSLLEPIQGDSGYAFSQLSNSLL